MISALALTLALTAPPAGACDEREPLLCAAPLMAGDLAPWSGQLVTTELAIRLGQKAAGCDALRALDAEHAAKLAAVDLGLERRLREVEAAEHDRAVDLLEAELRRALAAREVPLVERPAFVAGATFAATATIFTIAAYAFARVR